jgi:hypothetical protein
VRLSLLTALVSLNFSSCDFLGNKIQVTRAPSVATTVTKITPIAARPNEVVSLTGQNFSKTRDLKVSLDLTNGQRASVPLEVTDSQNASFAMPEGAGLGLKDVTLTQGRTEFEVAKFNLIADQADNQLPIIVGDSSTICIDQQYIDRNGDTKTGTKNCSAGVTLDACTADGVVGCVTTETYKSANLSNLTAENIKKDVSIAGVEGSYSGASPNAWDLRAGVTVGSVTGMLKVNCRNRANGDVNGDQVVDIWDTIDDYLGVPLTNVWGNNNTDCGGVEVTAGDDNVWKDVTTTSGGAASDCATDGARCTMQDKITGLWWRKLQASDETWNTAWATCAGLTYNGQTGWRLPTQKELMEAYTHGIRSAASTNWMTEGDMGSWFWSGSSVSYCTYDAWIVNLATGFTYYYNYYYSNYSSYTFQVVCVR